MRSRVAAILAGSALALGACTSSKGPPAPAAISTPTTARAGTTTTAVGGATSSTAPAAPPVRIGEDAETRDGNTVRVLTYQQPVDAGVVGSEQGAEFAAVEAEICAGRRGVPRVSPDSFRLELSDGTRRTRLYFGPKEPALTDTSLAAGACARGWVSFEVPEGERPAYVVFQGSSQLRWTTTQR